MSEIVWIPKSMRNETIEITKDEGYDFYDEYGNLIHSTKIVLEKKKTEYPKTYDDFISLVKRMRDAQEELDIFEHEHDFFEYEVIMKRKELTSKVIKLESEVDEYLNKMEE